MISAIAMASLSETMLKVMATDSISFRLGALEVRDGGGGK